VKRHRGMVAICIGTVSSECKRRDWLVSRRDFGIVQKEVFGMVWSAALVRAISAELLPPHWHTCICEPNRITYRITALPPLPRVTSPARWSNATGWPAELDSKQNFGGRGRRGPREGTQARRTGLCQSHSSPNSTLTGLVQQYQWSPSQALIPSRR
jgi:hypothetical protein